MDSQVLSLISGGAIAMFAAVITALVNYYFSNKRDNKEFIRRQKIETYTGFIESYSNYINQKALQEKMPEIIEATIKSYPNQAEGVEQAIDKGNKIVDDVNNALFKMTHWQHICYLVGSSRIIELLTQLNSFSDTPTEEEEKQSRVVFHTLRTAMRKDLGIKD